MISNQEKTNKIIRHIKRVEDNCNMMANEIMSSGEPEDVRFALDLIMRGRVHDLSKFSDEQFESLWFGQPNFNDAVKLHRTMERHHPEFHENGIHSMTDLDIAEMVCDCLARAQEFGTDIREWFFEINHAPKKYNYIGALHLYAKIEKYLSMVTTPPFEKNKLTNGHRDINKVY